MEPLLVSSRDLEDSVVTLAEAAGGLWGAVPEGARRGIVELLRVTNSYYSNLIEGHHTRPADIERAMHNDYDSDPKTRDLQREARAHIEVQRAMEAKLDADPSIEICSPEFLKALHKDFYERVPPEFRYVTHPTTAEKEEVIPGEFRSRSVRVGDHFPPPADAIGPMMQRFQEAYSPERLTRTQRILALAASHHRLMWIHPFLDGNGRVARLFSAAYSRKALLVGEGLWSISRGLARRRKEYYLQLANADSERQFDTDGRGALSERALISFSSFFLDTARDQIEYMHEILQPNSLAERVRAYAKLRESGALSSPSRGDLGWKEETGPLLEAVAVRGEVTRSDVPRLAGVHPRTARRITQFLLEEGLLESDSPKKPLRLGFPVHAVAVFFPNLYPEGVDWR